MCLLLVALYVKSAQPRALLKSPIDKKYGYEYSDIANFGTEAECDTDFGQNIERRPKETYEKTVEQKIIKHRWDEGI